MEKLRKITIQVPKQLLEKAQTYTGDGVTQTVRAALKHLAADQEWQEALKLRG